MKPFKPNKQQLEVITNGCTKLWIPLEKDGKGYSEYTHISTCDVCRNVSRVNVLLVCKACVQKLTSPLQQNEEYFVQEKFSDITDTYEESTNPATGFSYGKRGTVVLYKSTHKFNDDHIVWTSAEQMTEEQSRFKFKVTEVEVEHVQGICGNRKAELAGKSDNWLGYITDEFIDWYDRQYPEHPYASGPRGFLVTIERI